MRKIITIIVGILILTSMSGCGGDAEKLQMEGEIVQEVMNPETMQETAPGEVTQESVVVSGTDIEDEANEIAEKPQADTETVAPVSSRGPLHVEGSRLVDSNGAAVQLRGVSTHGIAWFPEYVNQEFFTELHEEWNANVVRLAMYVAEYGGYCNGGNQEDLKQLIKDGVNYATEAGMYVIVDWHVLQDANPNANKEEAKLFFEEISKEFADAENVLYEICNEPNGGTTWAEIKSYAEEVIPVIRANDEDAIIIVGTPSWSQEVDKAAKEPIEGYDNIMYALHFYAASHTDWLRDRMTKAIDGGLPIFVTEFGICDASGDGGINREQSDKWIQSMDEYGVSYVAWNLSNKVETSAIFSPNCSKSSGFTAEDLTENGKWIYEMLTGEHAEYLEVETVKDNESANGEISSSDLEDDGQPDNLSQNHSSKEGAYEDLTYTAVITNTWEADGQIFSQYTVTIENTSTQDVNEWSVSINFDEAITFSDGWNASFAVENNTMIITPVEYNSQLQAGVTLSDIGFIISSPTQ